MKKIIRIFLALTFIGAIALSCSKQDAGNTPGKKKAAEEDPDPTPVESETLCKPEFLGQTPMVVAYYTENSSEVPDPNYVTHINFAHGRFVNSKTGRGGIVIGKVNTSTDNSSYVALLKKVVAPKEKNPNLKVLLMIGGWGEAADGFSMMARSAEGRTEFCQSVKEKLKNYNLDGVDFDWEYPGGGPSTNAQSKDDAKNFNLVLKEMRETLGQTKILSYASSSSAK